MTVASYARVSTAVQDPAPQTARLRDYSWAKGWGEPRAFADRGYSGRAQGRPEFERLMNLVRAKEVKIVLATRVDRLARSAKALLQFFDECEAAGVRVVVTEQEIDTGTPVGRFLRTILAGVAELEGDMIRERIQESMDAIKAGERGTSSGRLPGRPRVVTPEKVRTIADLRAKGVSWAVVAQRTGLKKATCQRALLRARAPPPPAHNSHLPQIPPILVPPPEDVP